MEQLLTCAVCGEQWYGIAPEDHDEDDANVLALCSPQCHRVFNRQSPDLLRDFSPLDTQI